LLYYKTRLIYYRSITDDYETTVLLEDDEDDKNVESTDNLTHPFSKIFDTGVIKRYMLYIIIYYGPTKYVYFKSYNFICTEESCCFINTSSHFTKINFLVHIMYKVKRAQVSLRIKSFLA